MQAHNLEVDEKSYRPPRILRNPHIHTVCARYVRELIKFPVERTRISTPDGDFLDIDTAKQGARKLVLLSHGLEGRSDAPYMRWCGKLFFESGWDVLAWNFRDCGDMPNKFLPSYNCGKTDDLAHVINTLTSDYDEVVLVGFSVGGSIIVKYLGEQGSRVPANISKVVTISSPTVLEDSADTLKRGVNRIYLRYFLKSFKDKIKRKAKFFPNELPDGCFKGIRDFEDYDNRFTAPWFGYPHARAYWHDASCERFLPEVKVKTLFITAADDTFFTDKSIPWGIDKTNPLIDLRVTRWGGHVAFLKGLSRRPSWLQETLLNFVQDELQ